MSLYLLSERLQLLTLLKEYFSHPHEELLHVYDVAQSQNSWFTKETIEYAITNIVNEFLDIEKLRNWIEHYQIPSQTSDVKNVGIIMAGNLPLVGFHDVLCTFVSGHKSVLKLSSKDTAIWKHIINWLQTQHTEIDQYFEIKEQIPNCDAYIATGSNNTSRYFESFFQKYPHVIRKNRSSVAILSSADELDGLVHDVTSFFGLGCRNVSKVYLPEGFDLNKLLESFESKSELANHHSYRNNYDYHLAIYLLNKIPIQYNEVIILVENKEIHAPIGTLHYEYFKENENKSLIEYLLEDEQVQCIATNYMDIKTEKIVPIGMTQQPNLFQYPDGVDIMQFLKSL